MQLQQDAKQSLVETTRPYRYLTKFVELPIICICVLTLHNEVGMVVCAQHMTMLTLNIVYGELHNFAWGYTNSPRKLQDYWIKVRQIFCTM